MSEKDQLVLELITAAEGLLSTFALDWYVEIFGRSEVPTQNASGIAAKLHNHELTNRTRIKIEELRRALANIKPAIVGDL